MNLRAARWLFTFAAVVLLVAGWRALHLAEVRPLWSVTREASDSAPPAQRGVYSLGRLLAAMDKDPFHPDRRRPAHRLQFAGREGGIDVRDVAQNDLAIRVVGTAVSADGRGFAMCAWPDAPPRIVRVGEHVGDWTLHTVTPGAAQFVSSRGASVILRIAKPGGGS